MDLVKAMGFIAEAFSCAEEFLKSKRLHSTFLLDRGRADAWNDRTRAPQSFGSSGNVIPTILITAFPNEETRCARCGPVYPTT